LLERGFLVVSGMTMIADVVLSRCADPLSTLRFTERQAMTETDDLLPGHRIWPLITPGCTP